MSRWMTPELLADFEKRSEKWKRGSVKTHLLDTSPQVSIEREKKAGKYGNVKTEIDGIEFASRKEAGRYGALKLLQVAGAISDLQIKRRYTLAVNGVRICEYEDDFNYLEKGKRIIEDTKGMRTPLYKLKKKLLKACLGLEIKET